MSKDTIFTIEQIDYCYDDASKLAKEILDKDIYSTFERKDGNVNYSLEVICILTAGIISIASEKINYNQNKLADVFIERVKKLMKSHNEKPVLRSIQ